MGDLSLKRLSDSDLMLEDLNCDVRGLRVFDRHGNNIGSVKDLFIDERERKVRFLEISAGGFLGIGDRVFCRSMQSKKSTIRVCTLTRKVSGSAKRRSTIQT